MSVITIPAQNTRFKIGWITLLILAGLMVLMHFGLMFVLKDPVLFFSFGMFSLYAFLIILIPFRKGEKWAWAATWLLPVGLAIPATMDPGIAVYYFSFAAVCALGLLLTLRDFFPKR
jgi:hypothetical protein